MKWSPAEMHSLFCQQFNLIFIEFYTKKRETLIIPFQFNGQYSHKNEWCACQMCIYIKMDVILLWHRLKCDKCGG